MKIKQFFSGPKEWNISALSSPYSSMLKLTSIIDNLLYSPLLLYLLHKMYKFGGINSFILKLYLFSLPS